MRSTMVFGTIFFIWIAGISIFQSFRNISILKRGKVIAAVLVQKPKRYVPYRSGFKGTAIYHYDGIEFRNDMRKDQVGEFTVGDTKEFYYYPRYSDIFLEKWETEGKQYWTIGMGIVFAMIGGVCAWYWLVGVSRIERKQKALMDAALMLPNGKRRSKARYSHMVLKPRKGKGRP